jgi:hypothetical protein
MPTMNDLLLTDGDTTDDLLITNGDFVTGESTAQHQRQLLLNDKGDFKENPTACVGIYSYIDDEGLQALARDITVAYTQDGMKVNSVQLQQNGILDIDAGY